MKQRWALVIVGAWIAGSICTSVVATQNFYTIDRVLAARSNAAFASAVDRLGSPEARDLLRYLSSELNRLFFQLWNWAQLAVGLTALWLTWPRERASPAGRRIRVAIVSMLAIVVLMLAWLTPAIVTLGRSLDFVPRDPAPPGMQRFWILHGTYTSLEMIKLAISFVVALGLVKETSTATADVAGVAPGPAKTGHYR
jgi:hypothetical protein